MNRRRKVLVGILAGLLLMVVLWCYDAMNARHDAAQAANNDLLVSRQMAAEIERYARRPALATEHEQLATETTGLIESAAGSAKIDAKNLIRITPEPPRRLADTVYKEKPTHVFFKNISLRQLVTFIYGLLDDRRGLNAKSIRITSPRPEDTGLTWTVELTLTYLIYDPPNPQK